MKFGLVFCFFFLLVPCFGNNDSIRVETLRTFDKSKIEAIKADPDFSYVQESKVTHWWDGITAWIIKKLSDLFKDNSPEAIATILYTILKIVLWSLLAFALIMLGYSLYKNGAFGVFGKRKKKIDISFGTLEDKVLETDWNALIHTAIANRQYNVAIRFLFLQLLQALDQHNMIAWNKSKSIRDYQLELNNDYRSRFFSLAKYYQYSWFGEVTIDEKHFNEMHEEFKSFKINAHVD